MKWLLMILFGAGVVLVSLSVGVESLSLKEAFLHPDSLAGTLLWEVRLPRVLVGALVGMSLSVAGLAFQALLRNPLADPFILGVSGGGCFGKRGGSGASPFFCGGFPRSFFEPFPHPLPKERPILPPA